MHRWRFVMRSPVFLVTVAAAWLVTSEVRAAQVVVVDTTYDHVASLPDSHFRVDPLPGTPTNWKSPVDYSKGTAYVHLEVLTKPTDIATKWQACFEATPTYACVDQSPAYTKVGTYDWSTPFSKFYVPPGQSVDWSQGTKKIALILKDTANNKPSADNVGAEKAAMYMPTKLRVVITLVSQGGTYVPPGPAKPVTDGGAPADGGIDGASPMPRDDGGEPAVATPKPDSDELEDNASPHPTGHDEGGCNASGVPGGEGFSWFLAALVLGRVRARRRTTRVGTK